MVGPLRRSVLSLLVLLSLAAPAGAMASAGSEAIIGECANERLSKTYTQQDYRKALADLPADLREYTACYDVILAAQRAAARGATDTSGASGAAGTSGTSGTGGTAGTTSTGAVAAADPLSTASPEDQAAAKAAQQQGARAVTLGGATITPGAPGTLVSSLDELPAAVVVLLVLIVIAGLGGLGYAIKRRVVGDHPQ